MKGEQSGRCVDVIIAAWNRANTIERALLSALAEPEVRTVFVIDDCSTDDTAHRAEAVALSHNSRVVVRRMAVNGGPSNARNIGLELSSSAWVAILDGDDFFCPGRMTRLLSLADNYDFVADDLEQVMEGRKLPSLLETGRRKISRPWRLDLEAFALGNIGPVGHLGYLKPIMRRSFLERHNLRYDASLRLGEDYALYARALALRGRFLVIPERSYVSVKRIDSLASRHSRMDLEQLRDVDLELARMSSITAKEKRALRRHYESVDARAQWRAVTEAAKARSFARFLAPFFRSPAVSMVLIRNLTMEVCIRCGRRLLSLTKWVAGSMKRAAPNGGLEV